MKALEQLGFKIGPQSNTARGFSGSGGKKRSQQVAIATYHISEEDARKLTELAKARGVAPNELISQLLNSAPEFRSSENAEPREAEPSEKAPDTEDIEEKYRSKIADLQNKIAETSEKMRNLQQQLAKKQGKGKGKASRFNAEMVEATIEEIEAIPETVWRNAYAPSAARNIDLRSALANAGEVTIFLVQQLLKSLKKALATTSRNWDVEFAIDENQEIENWEPA